MLNLKPRWKKVIADLWSNKTRTVLVVLSIAIGVFAVGMVAQSYLILRQATEEGYTAINPTSAFIIISDFDNELVETVRDMPEVAQADGRRGRSVRLFLNGRWFSSEISALDFANSHVNLLEPIRGAAEPQDRQLLIDQTALALTDFDLDDVALVEMSDGRRYEMPLVGTVRDQNANPSINSGGINVYTTLDTFEWLGETAAYNTLIYIAQENQHDVDYIQALTGKIKDKIERSGYFVYFTLVFSEPGVSPTKFLVETIRTILGILALASLALSAFLVFNTLSALITRQVKFIGIMKALGANAGDITGMYLLLVAIYGLLAFLVALLPAAWGAQNFAAFIASPQLIDLPLPDFSLTWQVVVLELSVSLLVPLLAALPPIWRGTRISAHAALNSQGLSSEDFSGSLLERVIQRARFMTGPGLLSLGNIMRDKRRAALTLGTLTLGGAVFIGVISVSASADQTVAELGEAYRFDVRVNFERPYRLSTLTNHSQQIPGIVAAEGWTAANGSIIKANGEEGNSMTVLAPPVASDMTRPKIVDGRWLQPGDTNALVIDTSLLREEPTLAVGDEIVLKIRGDEIPWIIVGVYQSIGASVMYEAYGSYDYVSRLLGEIDQVRQLQMSSELHSPADQMRIALLVEEYLRERGLHVSQIETSSALRSIQADQFDIIVAVLLVMALLITLVGGLGLAGTMSMNVMERTREIGVMRAVGASDRDVLRVVLVEGILMALLSWAAAVVVAVPVGKFLSLVVGSDIVNGSLSYIYSFSGAGLWLLLVTVIALVASYFPARNASRLTVRDVLAYE